MDHQDTKSEGLDPPSADERELLYFYRHCTARRQKVIIRFASKLAVDGPIDIRRQIITNILPFTRRKDD